MRNARAHKRQWSDPTVHSSTVPWSCRIIFTLPSVNVNLSQLMLFYTECFQIANTERKELEDIKNELNRYEISFCNKLTLTVVLICRRHRRSPLSVITHE